MAIEYWPDPKTATVNEFGQTVIRTSYPFSALARVIGAVCADGKRRTARIHKEADTYWTVPARVSVGKKTVTGFVYFQEGEPIGFTANAECKNSRLIPKQVKYVDQ